MRMPRTKLEDYLRYRQVAINYMAVEHRLFYENPALLANIQRIYDRLRSVLDETDNYSFDTVEAFRAFFKELQNQGWGFTDDRIDEIICHESAHAKVAEELGFCVTYHTWLLDNGKHDQNYISYAPYISFHTVEPLSPEQQKRIATAPKHLSDSDLKLSE